MYLHVLSKYVPSSYSYLFVEATPSYKIKIQSKYECNDPDCQIVEELPSNQDIHELILDWNFQDNRDKTDGFIDNFFNRYVIETKTTGYCECNETLNPNVEDLYEFSMETILKNLQNILFLSLESIRTHEFPLIPSGSQNVTSLSNQKIEREFECKFKNKSVKLKLIAIINFENGNHFTLAFKDPRFQKKIYQGWSYFNSTHGHFIEYGNINFHLDTLGKSNRLPIILVYRTNV